MLFFVVAALALITGGSVSHARNSTCPGYYAEPVFEFDIVDFTFQTVDGMSMYSVCVCLTALLSPLSIPLFVEDMFALILCYKILTNTFLCSTALQSERTISV